MLSFGVHEPQPEAIVHDLCTGKVHPERISKGFYFWENPLFCLVDVPVAKNSPSFSRQGSRDQETLFQVYLCRVGRDNFDLILAAQVERRFAVHQFLARRMGLLVVLLSMLCLLINPPTFRSDNLFGIVSSEVDSGA